ncbi:hypothetical protein pb186bvf_019917 [Paramecium bursaria]
MKKQASASNPGAKQKKDELKQAEQGQKGAPKVAVNQPVIQQPQPDHAQHVASKGAKGQSHSNKK